MTEVDNKNYGTIEEQFKIIRDYIVREEDPRNLLLRYDKLDINKNLKEGLKGFGATITATLFLPIADNAFHCLNKEKNKKELINFIFSFGQNNLDTFLNNEQIDAQDKFSALITKYAIISQLPEEFKDTRDKEMDLLYNNIEKISKDYANYIEKNGLGGGEYVLLNSLTQIIGNIFSNDSKTDYNKDIKFITDIYKNIPLLIKDRVINFQGQPGFNKIIERFLMKPCKNNDILNFFKDTIQNDPTCIYKFATTYDGTNQKYEQIEKNKDFSGNFICNFPNALDENGKIKCVEDRCKYNIFSDILYTLNYKELPEDVGEDVKQMANLTLESLSNHIKSLRENNNLEELQKINYLLNCPIEIPSIQDPNTKDIVTPMDLINNLRKQGIINITKEQMGQFRTEPVCLQTVEEVKNSIEFKKAVAKKQKEEKMKETQIDLNADGYMERIFLSKEEKEEQKRLKDKEESISLNEYRTMEEIFTPEVLQREIIEEQFKIIRDYIIGEKDFNNLSFEKLNKLKIIDSLKERFNFNTDLKLFAPIKNAVDIGGDIFNCLDNEKNKNELINFIFGFGQNNLDTFLNNKQIDAQDKFSALIIKYDIISKLPDEFKDTRDEEIDLLRSHIKEVSKNCAEYNVENGWVGTKYILSDSLTSIINDNLLGYSKTDFNKDLKFLVDIYENIPILTKDRIINFQGEPGFNRLIKVFLIKPYKNNDILNFFKDTIQNDPTCIYKFATTYDGTNQKYEQIEKNKDFSGNFICNFPNALDGNGEINCEETRCKYNVLSDILYTLNYVKLPEDVREDVKQMANVAFKSLSNHLKSLRDNGNIEELQKINYLLNCPIEIPSVQDPNTKDIVTPMDLINNLAEKGIINLTEEQMEQFRTEPVCLQTVEEVKNSIEFKKAVAKKQKEEKMKETQIDLNADGYMERIFLSKEEKEEQKRLKDKEESISLNEYRTMEEIFTPEVFEVAEAEVKKKEKELETEKENTKASMIYKIFNFFSKTFLKRDTKYRTKKEISIEKQLNEKKAELSGLIFNSVTKTTEKQIQTLNQNISKEQTRGTEINNSKSIENHAI